MQVGTLTTPNTGLVGRTELYKGKDFRNYEVPDYIPEIEMRFPINYNVAPNSLIDVLKKEQMIYNSSFQGPMTRALLENGRQDVLEKIYEENDKEDVDKDENFNLEEGAEVTPRALRRIIYNNDYLIPTLKRADPQLYNNKTLGNNVGEYFDLDYNRGSGILSCKKGGSVAAALGIGALAAAAYKPLKAGYEWTKKKALVTGTKLRDKALNSYLYVKSRPEQARRNRTIKKDIKNINKVGTIKSIKDWWNDHRAQSKRNNMDRIENMKKINAIMKPTIVSEDHVSQPFVEKYLAPVFERGDKRKPDLNPDFNEEKAKELYGLLEQREKDMKSIKKKPKLFRTKLQKAMLDMYNEQNQRYAIPPALTGEIGEMYKDNSGKMLVHHHGREMKKDFDELLNRQNNNDEDGTYKKFKTPDTETDAMYLIKANAPINTEAHANAQSMMSSGKVKFLIDERVAKTKLLGTKVGQNMKPEERAEYLKPFTLTSILREEMMNLREENEGVNIILRQANRGIKKDKFSAFEYGLYYIKQEESSKKKKKFNAKEWRFFN